MEDASYELSYPRLNRLGTFWFVPRLMYHSSFRCGACFLSRRNGNRAAVSLNTALRREAAVFPRVSAPQNADGNLIVYCSLKLQYWVRFLSLWKGAASEMLQQCVLLRHVSCCVSENVNMAAGEEWRITVSITRA